MPYGKRLLVGVPGPVLEELYKVGLIRISEIRPPGRRRTLRLVHMPTLLRFIREHGELTDRLVEETKREFYGPMMPAGVSGQTTEGPTR